MLWQHWYMGKRYGILYVYAGSESILVRDQAGRDVVFDVLKALHQDGGH